MEQDTNITDVVFRKDTTKDFEGTIFALLPHECECRSGQSVTSYQHVGQHSSANYQHCIENSTPATEEEYADLKKEMEGLGYNFKVVKKQDYSKFIESWEKIEKQLGS